MVNLGLTFDQFLESKFFVIIILADFKLYTLVKNCIQIDGTVLQVINMKKDETYGISSVLKLTMLEMKLSRIMIDLMAFQSTSGSPSSKQIASRDSFTSGGGLGRARISAKCCFLMAFTAVGQQVGGQKVCK